MNKKNGWLDTNREENKSPLDFLVKHGGGSAQPFETLDSVSPGFAYMNLGSHPDVVERLWDGLALELPEDSRCLVYRTPAIVGRHSGVLFGFTIGTGYFLRKPISSLVEEDLPITQVGVGYVSEPKSRTDDIPGPDWFKGSWQGNEVAWLKETWEHFELKLPIHDQMGNLVPKGPLFRLNEDEVRIQFPITTRLCGWYFRIRQMSQGVYELEGTDLWGRRILKQGVNSEELLAEGVQEAGKYPIE